MARTTRSSGKAASSPAKKKAAPAAKKEPPTKKNKAEAPTTSKKLVTIKLASNEAAFKTRANKIVRAVGDAAVVQVNPEKPGKGTFVVKVVGVEEPIVELLGMKRPFQPLKALDMDEVSSQVLAALEKV
eukprot:CAMPEP_0202494868 /NCGR_PEP_ID=MMETSP1361-20130828/14134_1 /ASSEMBLY_ACC=CAM_ASM_000849 /TAXON_ID=210615 /ORGANISM="Staurosira complex sp., Strain CCMP2646" /LENGTH=128 /DNA_ID=CAMNT_0049125623 /DNA_START=27 /DNA_END=413 /DNA_ORIENTATION=+